MNDTTVSFKLCGRKASALTETSTVSQALSQTSVPNLTNALVADWEQISAARFQHLLYPVTFPEGCRLSYWNMILWSEMFLVLT